MFDPLTRKSLVAVGVLALGLHAAAAAGAEAHRHFPQLARRWTPSSRLRRPATRLPSAPSSA